MSRRKDTAHRPSQSDQEFVLRSDGTKVRNTAYKPRVSSRSEPQKYSSEEFTEDTTHMDTQNTRVIEEQPYQSQDIDQDLYDSGLDSVFDIVDRLNARAPLSYSSVENMSKLIRKMGTARRHGDTSAEEKTLQEDGIHIRDIQSVGAEGCYRYEVDIDNTPPHNDMPNHITLEIVDDDDNPGTDTRKFTMTFDNKEVGVQKATSSYYNGMLVSKTVESIEPGNVKQTVKSHPVVEESHIVREYPEDDHESLTPLKSETNNYRWGGKRTTFYNRDVAAESTLLLESGGRITQYYQKERIVEETGKLEIPDITIQTIPSDFHSGKESLVKDFFNSDNYIDWPKEAEQLAFIEFRRVDESVNYDGTNSVTYQTVKSPDREQKYIVASWRNQDGKVHYAVCEPSLKNPEDTSTVKVTPQPIPEDHPVRNIFTM